MIDCYYAEEGLTSTSANFIANKSKEMIDAILAESNRISFINKEYTVVGKAPICADGGKSETWLRNVVASIAHVGELSSLNAWLREAIKNKDEEIGKLNTMTIDEWCKANGKEQKPTPANIASQLVAIDDNAVIKRLSPSERQKYLRLEAVSAAIGKFIHKGMPFDTARKDLHKLQGSTDVSGTGDQLTIIKHVPSISTDFVDKTYMELQEEYRKVQAELNGVKNKVKLEVTRLQQELLQKNKLEWTEYNAQVRELSIEFEGWRKAEVQRIAALKIKIPSELQGIYEYVKRS